MSSQNLNEEQLKLFTECQFLTVPDVTPVDQEFTVEQPRLFLASADIYGENASGKVNFADKAVSYSCFFQKAEGFNSDLPALLICIKDNHKLLKYTLENLAEYEVKDKSNVIVIDDRPTSDDIKLLAEAQKCSYLKVDYQDDFSFSMLNNIPAKIAKELGCSKIVLWNSDMWAKDKETFPELLRLHDENRAKISGVKLVYPPFRWDGNETEESLGIPKYWESKSDSYRGTTQHGGIIFTGNPIFQTYMPGHCHRFIDPDHPLVNCDKGDLAITGAFMIIDLNWFVELGGFNPSLPRIFQDIDLCLSADRVLYFGKDKFFYHDESLSTLSKVEQDVDDKMFADSMMFANLRPQRFFNKIFVYE